MSVESLAAGDVREAVADVVSGEEVASLVEDGDGESSAIEGQDAVSVGRDVGGRVGRELGAFVGGELGATVVGDVGDESSSASLWAAVKRRLVDLVRDLLGDVDVEEVVSRFTSIGASLAAGESPASAFEDVLPDADGSDRDSEAESEGEVDVSELGASDLRELREETYRDLLEVMSYSDLQSVAKEVGVKANVSEEEMIERIVDAFSGDSSGDS